MTPLPFCDDSHMAAGGTAHANDYGGPHVISMAQSVGGESMVRQASLVCGIISSLLYVAMNVYVAMQWEGYSSASQTVSELSAIAAPTRPLWVSLGIAYTLLVTAFGWGVWASARRNRPLRVVGELMVVYGIIGLAWPLAPMHLRGTEATLTDTIHIGFAIVTALLMLVAIGFSAAAFGKRFRLYSIATMVMLVAFGALAGLDGPRIAVNLPTPWVGVWERINIGVFLLWVVVLAIVLLRVEQAICTRVQEVDTTAPRRIRQMFGRSVRATFEETTRPLPGDDLIPQAKGSLIHAITIARPPQDVWPWLAQMGAGSRAGWYSYDFVDNCRKPSAIRVVPDLQHLAVGMVFPALPGATGGFTLLAFEPDHFLILGWVSPNDRALLMTWAFVLRETEHRLTRLIVRARAGAGYKFQGLPWWLGKRIAAAIHFIMQRKQLLGIARRAESWPPSEPNRGLQGSRSAA
jgi:hypothetical protein